MGSRGSNPPTEARFVAVLTRLATGEWLERRRRIHKRDYAGWIYRPSGERVHGQTVRAMIRHGLIEREGEKWLAR